MNSNHKEKLLYIKFSDKNSLDNDASDNGCIDPLSHVFKVCLKIIL